MNRPSTTHTRLRKNTDVINQIEHTNPLARDTLYDLIFNRSTLNEKISTSKKRELVLFVIKYLLIRPTILVLSWYIIVWLASHLIDDDLIEFIQIKSWLSVIYFVSAYCLFLIIIKSKKCTSDASLVSNGELAQTFNCNEREVKLIKISKYIEAQFYHEHTLLSSELIDNVLIELPFKISNLNKYQQNLNKDKSRKLNKTIYRF
jgi:hypothetical protein